MKEERYFYAPDALSSTELPEDEAKHAVSVLRLQAGDEVFLIDGKGTFHRAEITMATKKHCNYRIIESLPQEREWSGRIHLAMAPTKMMDRIEWFAEKATEIGFDELSFLDCRLSERRNLRIDRIETKVLGAVKQSRKAWMPIVNDMQSFSDFIEAHNPTLKQREQQSQISATAQATTVPSASPLGSATVPDESSSGIPNTIYCIAHCYDDIPKEHLFTLLSSNSEAKESPTCRDCPPPCGGVRGGSNVVILIGPEGDFHHEEVELALSKGYHSISLGTSRLRTETAALSAVMMARLINS
ncbi:MAG: 16S rRNA (uracil(1498)-N(3))-methyltransferase [Bacteroidaceae bacterium]|nr:16S rRNA (uracil(1498)-N(3))-methyltransferase [Bacteroidaceae bacterium]